MINELTISRRLFPIPAAAAASRPAPRQLERACRCLLWLAICAYAAVFVGLTFRLYDRFATASYDLAIFDQAAWLISRGHSPFDPIFVTVRGLPLLADHFSLILYLLAPLYWIWPSAKMLLLAQTLALALGALPLYALARKRLGSAPWALLLAAAYLLYPALEWSGTFEFHPDTFATPLLLAAFWFLECRRWPAYFLCLALALMTKETVGLTVLAVGVYALRTDRRIGVTTLILGVAGMAAALLTVRAFNHGAPSAFFALYGPDGVGPDGLLRMACTHPLLFWHRLATVGNGVYVFQLLYPLAFLPFLAPEVLVLALPALLLNLLSARPVMHTVQHQYTATLTPLLLLAALAGAERARRWGNRWTPLLLAGVIGVGLISAQDQGPLFAWRQWLSPGLPAVAAQEAGALLDRIPADASVSASVSLLPHLDHRRLAYAFPNPFERVASGPGPQALRQMEYRDYSPQGWPDEQASLSAGPVEYIALAPSTSTFPLPPDRYPGSVAGVLHSPAYGIIWMGRQVLVLRRGADHARGLRQLSDRSGVIIPAADASTNGSALSDASTGGRAAAESVGERRALEKAVKNWLAEPPSGASCGCSSRSPAL